MDLSTENLLEVSLITGGAVAGTAIGYTAITKAPNKIKKFVPYGTIAIGFGAMLLSDHPLVTGIGGGMIAVGTSSAVTALTKPKANSDGSFSESTGIKKILAESFPTIGSVNEGYELPAMDMYDIEEELDFSDMEPVKSIGSVDLSNLA